MPAQSQARARTDLEIDRRAHTIRLIAFSPPRGSEIFEAWTRRACDLLVGTPPASR